MHGRLLLLACLSSLLMWPAQAEDLDRAPPAAVGLSEERFERIRDVLRAHVKEGHIAGAVATSRAEVAWSPPPPTTTASARCC